MTRPICINIGCGQPVTFTRKDSKGNRRWRVHCSHCQAASYGRWPHRPGVTPFKTGRCSNHDGHLGFDCITNLPNAPDWAKGLTEVDHINGDRDDNSLENLQELCIICHKLKGVQQGDFGRIRYTRLESFSPVKHPQVIAYQRLFA